LYAKYTLPTPLTHEQKLVAHRQKLVLAHRQKLVLAHRQKLVLARASHSG
jgi:hypothetical protein